MQETAKRETLKSRRNKTLDATLQRAEAVSGNSKQMPAAPTQTEQRVLHCHSPQRRESQTRDNETVAAVETAASAVATETSRWNLRPLQLRFASDLMTLLPLTSATSLMMMGSHGSRSYFVLSAATLCRIRPIQTSAKHSTSRARGKIANPHTQNAGKAQTAK